MSLDYKLLGNRIKELRIKKNITQESIAEITGVTNVYISRIELGISKPSLETLVKICNALDTTIDFLLSNSIFQAKEHLNEDIAILIKDCTSEEINLIGDMIKVILNHRKDN